MSSSALRVLQLLELLAEEPMRQADLARRLHADHAGVSRTLKRLEEERWVVRLGGLYRLGPRVAAFGLAGTDRAFVESADDFVRLLSGVTGLAASAMQLRHTSQSVVASSVPTAFEPLFESPHPDSRLWLTASGVALLAQASDDVVDEVVIGGDSLQVTPTTPASDDVLGLIAEVRAGSPARDRSWTIPGCACLALPWRHPLAESPAALAIVGFEQDFAGREAELEVVLRAAVEPGAKRADVLRAAMDLPIRR